MTRRAKNKSRVRLVLPRCASLIWYLASLPACSVLELCVLLVFVLLVPECRGLFEACAPTGLRICRIWLQLPARYSRRAGLMRH